MNLFSRVWKSGALHGDSYLEYAEARWFPAACFVAN